MEEKGYRYGLHKVPGIGNKTAISLLQKGISAKELFGMKEERIKALLLPMQAQAFLDYRRNTDLEKDYENLRNSSVKMVTFFDRDYPAGLKKIEDPPFVLYYIGKLPEQGRVSLAIIGARECSAYGSSMAAAFARGAAFAGVDVISGMARGIDGIAQEHALAEGGETYAVLGCGVDICYPKSNRELYDRIPEKGGICSPYPPGTEPVKTLFPYRNKIVAGLSDAVLVIEARQKSGTLITVDMALEQGKDVYAVPGRLVDRLSDGCNYLLRQGAGIALSPEDLMAELLLLKNRSGAAKKRAEKGAEDAGESLAEGRKAEKVKSKTPEDDRQGTDEGLLKYLDVMPRSVDEICESVKADGENPVISKLLFELIGLCMAGKARQISGNYFIKII